MVGLLTMWSPVVGVVDFVFVFFIRIGSVNLIKATNIRSVELNLTKNIESRCEPVNIRGYE